MGKDLAFSIGAVVVGGLVWVLTLHPPDLPNPAHWMSQRVTLPGTEPVLVLVVGSSQNVEVMRRVLDAERVVASAPEGFAFDSGCIVSASVEQAGVPIVAAGWTDRPVEILDPSRQRPEEPEEDAEGSTDLGGPMTQAEALALLDAVEF